MTVRTDAVNSFKFTGRGDLPGYPAVWSNDGPSSSAYRYVLWRDLVDPNQTDLLDSTDIVDPDVVNFICLNPASATTRVVDGSIQDDNTVCKCWRWALMWEYDLFVMTNIFAYRTTYPWMMKKMPDPVGPHNDDWIKRVADRADRIIVAWGNDGDYRDRATQVLEYLSDHELYALRVTQQGHPNHPSRLGYDQDLVRYDETA